MKNNYLKINNLKHLFLFLVVFGLAACTSSDDDGSEPIVEQFNDPIVLDCNFFQEARVLTDDPYAPVDYIVTCRMHITAPIKIEPGVVIEFEEDAGLETDDFHTADGSLSAVGTAEKPIIFRGTQNNKGWWRGIMFDSNSTLNELTHTQVLDAGGKPFNSNGDKGAVHVYASSRLKMTNSLISNSESYGLNATYTSSIITLENNRFTNNNAPAVVNPGYLNAINNTNLYSGNTSDFVYINPYGEEITSPTTWSKIDVPYSVVSNAVKSIRVRDLLTIQPGVVIEFGAETELHIHEDGGGLKAVGTSTDPIIFTGVSKVPKAWKGIRVYSEHAENKIAHAEIHYSGLGAPQGNVWLWYESLLNIHDVKFMNINGCAINYRVLTGQGSNPNLTIGENVTVDNGCVTNVW